MAGMTPTECYVAMQGTEGIALGLTTVANSPDPDVAYTHLSCLALEASGGCTRYTEGVTYPPGATAETGQPWVMWMPVAGATPPEPPPIPDATLPSDAPAAPEETPPA
jgi:hypothetical protein